MRIAIIEDENLIAEDLQQQIQSVLPEAEFVAVLSSIQEAVSHFTTHDLPDLFFSDIQLSDGLSFEFFKQLQIDLPVIFITAYDKYALQAFRANGIDYLLKPFTKESIQLAIERFYRLQGGHKTKVDFDQIIEQYLTKRDTDVSFLVNKGDKILAIKLHEIDLVYIREKSTFIITKGQRFRISRTLDQMEKEVGDYFYRINRQMLIGRKGIKDVSRYFARKLKINPHFEFDEPIVVSKTGVTNFLKWWENK